MLRIILFGCALLGAAVILAQHGLARAAEPPALSPASRGGDLTLRDVIGLTLERNPKLAGHRFALAAVAARRDQAALRPQLEAGIDVENVLGTGRLSAFGDTETTLRLGTVLELSDKRARRVGIADGERDLLAISQNAERLDILAEVARKFIALLQAQEGVTISRQDTALAMRARDIVKIRLDAGRATTIEQGTAELAVLRTQRDQQRAALAVRQAWASLSAVWGGVADQTGVAIGRLLEMAPVGDFATLSALIDQNPDILRFASERRVYEATLRLAEAARVPDLAVNGGIRRLQADRAMAGVLSLSVPLGTESRARPFEAEARSRMSVVEFEQAARRHELLAALFALHQELVQRRAEFEAITAGALPMAQAVVKSAEDGFRSGRFSLLELTAAQQQAIALQREALDAAAAYHLLFLELERLTGRADPESSRNLSSLETRP